MVHADHDEPSFFSNGANQIQQQLHRLYRASSPTRVLVFRYLDEHPDVHQEYLELLRPSVPSSPLNPSFGAGVVSESDCSTSATAERYYLQPEDDLQEDLWQLVAGVEEAAEEAEYESPLNVEGFVVDNAIDDEEPPQAGPEVLLDNINTNSIDSDDVDPHGNSDGDNNDNGTTIVNNNTTTIDTNDAGPVVNNDDSLDTDDTTSIDNTSASTVSNDTPGASSSVDSSMVAYPAPAHLVAASRSQPVARAWALWEEDACIRHMLDIHREGQIQGEARFAEALRRMQVVDGCQRTAGGAVKNFWNRKGRLRSQFDERRNRRAPLATSQQGKKVTRNTTTTSKQRKVTTSGGVTKSRSTTKRRQKRLEYPSEEEEEESDFLVESHNEEPEHLRQSRKRKDRDDDSEGDYQPSPTLINSVAKGLRTSKRVRSTA
ncbi:hypothetical protein A1O7_07057 [Cladophialophora yegresii CBS 114405]|uniref:Uncharacterized protein n=1 Tax=Cladophialophora yegresii CBS 114405 TaxID=1182544 RepID=W9VMF6_9EURO|nr:uncharacterized protein A1O7_07057 [Cladophialophora yegresii CBS 114405]EXJ56713.1 hypothetical protein A1O7_07057 [Cladophialophora yegresii CBS 114405]